MGAMVSTVVYQPLLLGVAATLMTLALLYQQRSCTNKDNTKDAYGSEIFKLNMGVSIVVVIVAIIVGAISALSI